MNNKFQTFISFLQVYLHMGGPPLPPVPCKWFTTCMLVLTPPPPHRMQVQADREIPKSMQILACPIQSMKINANPIQQN